MMRLLALLALAVSATAWHPSAAAGLAQLPPTCDRKIYCDSDLLHRVQLAQFYNDSKTFVDFKLLASEEDILAEFATLLADNGGEPTREQLQSFVDSRLAPGDELEAWTPPDLADEPAFLARVADPTLRQFGRDLNAIWPILGRRVRDEVTAAPDRYSLIPLPHGFCVPGGRFKEIYYWDSYWIIRGLITCGMKDTAQGMIENFLSLVKLLGHIPNGSRVYYQQRSQPPLLVAMVDLFVKASEDLTWLRANIETIESELQFWLDHRTVSVKQHTLLRYNAPSLGPRPESYSEDYAWASGASFASDGERQQFYTDIKSAAESGWDFSSRWFSDATRGDLTTVRTSRIVPVDLNGIFAGALQTMGDLRAKLGDFRAAGKWRMLAARWRYAIERVLWHSADGVWYDYDLSLGAARRQFYPSNLAPLWAGAVEPVLARDKGRRVLRYITKPGALDYPGGVPTSLRQTGEQWDFPNAWPPLQSIVIGALDNSGNAEARALARRLAGVWVRSNYRAFNETRKMFEKYDVQVVGAVGGGGEYDVQDGFGWTNGVVFELLDKYGDVLTLNDSTESDSYSRHDVGSLGTDSQTKAPESLEELSNASGEISQESSKV